MKSAITPDKGLSAILKFLATNSLNCSTIDHRWGTYDEVEYFVSFSLRGGKLDLKGSPV